MALRTDRLPFGWILTVLSALALLAIVLPPSARGVTFVIVWWAGVALMLGLPLLFALEGLSTASPYLSWRVYRRVAGESRLMRHAGRVGGLGVLMRAERGAPLLPPDEAEDLALVLPATFADIRAPEAPEAVVFDAWVVCAIAVSAERAGDYSQAEAVVRLFEDLPRTVRVPLHLRKFGLELLAWQAAERGDWDSARRRARLARGRGAWLLRVASRARLRHQGALFPLCWLLWLLAPERLRSWKALRARATRIAPPGAGVRLSPWQEHLRLLRKAAGETPPTMSEIQALVDAWEPHLAASALAQLRARGLQVGAGEPARDATGLRERVLDDVVLAAAHALGRLPAAGGALASTWTGRVRSALLERVRAAGLRLLEVDKRRPPRSIEAWQRWVELYGAVTQLHRALGDDELGVAWHAGLRTAAWSGPCALLALDGLHFSWAAAVMFDWTARLAEIVGDKEAAEVNSRNARAARQGAA